MKRWFAVAAASAALGMSMSLFNEHVPPLDAWVASPVLAPFGAALVGSAVFPTWLAPFALVSGCLFVPVSIALLVRYSSSPRPVWLVASGVWIFFGFFMLPTRFEAAMSV